MSNNEEQKNEQVINTEAAKAKVNEVAGKAQEKGKEFLGKIKTDKKTQYTVGGVVVAVIVLIILLNIIFPGSKSVVKGYMKAYQNQKASKIVSYYHKDYVSKMDEYFEDSDDYDSYEEYLEELFDEDESEIVSFEITDSKTLSKNKTEDIADDLDDAYDIKPSSVKKVVKYTVKVKTENEDGDKDTDKDSIYAVKIGLKWYVFDSLSE